MRGNRAEKGEIMPDLSFIEDLLCTSVGKEADRAYYIPFPFPLNKELPRGESPSFISLDGEWRFKKYDSAAEIADDKFLTEEYVDTIPVPSCVQYYGQDTPQYSGGRYPFPFLPPKVPRKNPAFCYRKNFCFKRQSGKRAYLVFEGADSCVYVYINKKFVGYAEISHADREFDVTDFLADGENTLDAIVLKWCKGSYLEAQDKWRFSGLFRSVYLLIRPERHIADYKISSDTKELPDSGKRKWFLRFSYLRGNASAKVSFEGETHILSEGETAVFEVKSPRLWTAETPELYDLLVESNGEYILERVALRKIDTERGIVRLNGVPVKFRGANRHDFSPKTGAVVTREEMLRDVRLMKEYNFNAVRTSHYPNSPEFYKLCDRYGLYVVSEADIECHGAVSIDGEYDEENFRLLSDNPAWEGLYLARISSMYERDKNRGCILFWSLGNESGYGRNQESCARYLRKRDSRLIHYEGIQCRRDHKTDINEDIYYTPLLDVVSRMYPSAEYIREKVLGDEREFRPLLLCEYAHGMGNGPGGLKEYWDLIRSEEKIAGAFVWEWADHGIDKGDGKYRYGSDFDVPFSDGNYCIDGVFGPDREIKPSAEELKHSMRPFLVRRLGGGKYCVKNDFDFLDSLNVSLRILFREEGRTLEEKVLSIALAPKEETEISAPFPIAERNTFRCVRFEFVLAEDFGILKKGHILAWDSFPLTNPSYFSGVSPVSFFGGKETTAPVFPEIVGKTPKILRIGAGDSEYLFDRFSGTLLAWKHKGKEVLAGSLRPQIVRAPVDNDVQNEKEWKKRGLYIASPSAISEETSANPAFSCIFSADGYRPQVTYRVRYSCSDGLLGICFEVDVSEKTEFLPRFGIAFEVGSEYSEYTYLGYGPGESYVDKREGAYKDVFTRRVREDFQSYLKPQESSSRFDVSYLRIKGKTDEIFISAKENFSFSATPYTVGELMRAGHDWQLSPSDKTAICVDYKMSGTGSESCGPRLDEKYRLNEKHFTFSVGIQISDPEKTKTRRTI